MLIYFQMLLSKCNNKEPLEAEILAAEKFTSCLKPYQPLGGDPDKPSVNLSTAILLVNKYCAKLPSDTFTKLTALWRCARTQRNGIDFYQYTIRLPINSPLKRDILVCYNSSPFQFVLEDINYIFSRDYLCLRGL